MSYETIPVDTETKQLVLAMCAALGMPRRSQGALVKNVVKAEYEKMVATGKILPVEAPKTEQVRL
jgi:hypothetical protein